jgi:hypothetical protein
MESRSLKPGGCEGSQGPDACDPWARTSRPPLPQLHRGAAPGPPEAAATGQVRPKAGRGHVASMTHRNTGAPRGESRRSPAPQHTHTDTRTRCRSRTRARTRRQTSSHTRAHATHKHTSKGERRWKRAVPAPRCPRAAPIPAAPPSRGGPSRSPRRRHFPVPPQPLG